MPFSQDRDVIEGVIEAIRDYVIVTDLDGTITHVNSAACERFGYSAEEMVGQPARICMSRDNPPETWDQIRQTREDLISGEASDWVGDVINVSRDGEEFWVSAHTTLLRRGGKPVGMVVVSRDISRRKRFEERLLMLEWVAESIEHFVVVTDMTGRITYVNPAVEERFGYEAEELRGQQGGSCCRRRTRPSWPRTSTTPPSMTGAHDRCH